MSAPSGPVKVFISHAQADEKLLDELEAHLATLRRLGLIDTWQRRSLAPGSEQAPEIDAQLDSAELVLLLISPSFLATDACFEGDLAQAMRQHQAGRSRVLPIVVRPVDLTGTPVDALTVLPRDRRPVSSWPQRDEAWLDVVKDIRGVVGSLRPKPEPPVAAPPPRPAPAPLPAGRPTAASLRRVLSQLFRTANDFDAFCCDHFPAIYDRFSANMEQVAKVNLLLTVADRLDLYHALSENVPGFAQHRHLIAFEPDRLGPGYGSRR